MQVMIWKGGGNEPLNRKKLANQKFFELRTGEEDVNVKEDKFLAINNQRGEV